MSTVEDAIRELNYCIEGVKMTAEAMLDATEAQAVTDPRQLGGVFKTMAAALEKALSITADVQYTCEKADHFTDRELLRA
jgi:hypothetical protein